MGILKNMEFTPPCVNGGLRFSLVMGLENTKFH